MQRHSIVILLSIICLACVFGCSTAIHGRRPPPTLFVPLARQIVLRSNPERPFHIALFDRDYSAAELSDYLRAYFAANEGIVPSERVISVRHLANLPDGGNALMRPLFDFARGEAITIVSLGPVGQDESRLGSFYPIRSGLSRFGVPSSLRSRK